MASKKNINEELSRFNQIMGYNPAKGSRLDEKRQPWQYTINEDEEGENAPEEESEEGGNADFDFGDEGSPEEGGGSEGGDFDFGDEGMPEDPESGEDFDFGGEAGGQEDEFGTASEFSAVDDAEMMADEDVEEIDVTDIVQGSEEAKELAQQAVSVGMENGEMLKAFTDKLANLEAQLTKMDTIASKIGKLEQDIKTPEERLELRSLDSYPFNQKLSDYWEEKAQQNDNYRISNGESTADGQTKEYVINPDEIEDYNEVDVKNSFNPEGGEVNVYKRTGY